MTSSDDYMQPHRKQRKREHVIADLSENYLERKILLNGHVLQRTTSDYGVDVTMFHFNEQGEVENGEVRFQLKATDNLKMIRHGSVISISVHTGDLHHWALEIYPMILIVFDAKRQRAYWLDVVDFVQRYPEAVDPDQKTCSLHIPVENMLTRHTIKSFRNKSLQIANRLRRYR